MRRRFTAIPLVDNYYISYISSDNEIVTPHIADFGTKLEKNEIMSDGSGRMTFISNVLYIGDKAFYNCDNLQSITIPDGVTFIGSESFGYCYSLESVAIGNGVMSIEGEAFCDCISLTDLTIPASVNVIGPFAFNGCESLTNITIPDNVTEIGDYAFANCVSLSTIYCKAITPPTLGANAFSGIFSFSLKFYVPYKSVESYKTAVNWSRYANYIVGYDFENDVVVPNFPVTLVGGDNGQTGIDLYNYLYSKVLQNNSQFTSIPSDEFNIGNIEIQGWGEVRGCNIVGTEILRITLMNMAAIEAGITVILESSGYVRL